MLAVVESDDAGVLVEKAADLELLLITEAGENVALKMSDTTFSRAESLRIRALTRSGMPRSPMISRTMWMPSVKTIPPRSSGMLCQSSAEHPTGVAAWNRARVIGPRTPEFTISRSFGTTGGIVQYEPNGYVSRVPFTVEHEITHLRDCRSADLLE